jgi:hypothetical protein
MNTSRTVSLRGFAKAVVAALLVVLLFLSALAAANPALHHWIHADDKSPTHYCLASAVEQGHGDAASVMVFVPVVEDFVAEQCRVTDQSFLSIDSTLHSGRGPPCLS